MISPRCFAVFTYYEVRTFLDGIDYKVRIDLNMKFLCRENFQFSSYDVGLLLLVICNIYIYKCTHVFTLFGYMFGVWLLEGLFVVRKSYLEFCVCKADVGYFIFLLRTFSFLSPLTLQWLGELFHFPCIHHSWGMIFHDNGSVFLSESVDIFFSCAVLLASVVALIFGR